MCIQVVCLDISPVFDDFYTFMKIFDRELTNAVKGITIWLVDLLPTFRKPFTQFEAYYVMLCNISLDVSSFVLKRNKRSLKEMKKV